MPIGSLERYDFDYDLKKGVELKFYSNRLSEYENWFKICSKKKILLSDWAHV